MIKIFNCPNMLEGNAIKLTTPRIYISIYALATDYIVQLLWEHKKKLDIIYEY